MPLNEWWYENIYKWCHESRRNYTFVNLKATRSDAFLFWSRDPDGYRKNDRKRAVVWLWLVLEPCTVLALTQLGIRQSDWWRVGIRSTNLHTVVENIVSIIVQIKHITWLHYFCLCSKEYSNLFSFFIFKYKVQIEVLNTLKYFLKIVAISI